MAASPKHSTGDPGIDVVRPQSSQTLEKVAIKLKVEKEATFTAEQDNLAEVKDSVEPLLDAGRLLKHQKAASAISSIQRKHKEISPPTRKISSRRSLTSNRSVPKKPVELLAER